MPFIHSFGPIFCVFLASFRYTSSPFRYLPFDFMGYFAPPSGTVNVKIHRQGCIRCGLAVATASMRLLYILMFITFSLPTFWDFVERALAGWVDLIGLVVVGARCILRVSTRQQAIRTTPIANQTTLQFNLIFPLFIMNQFEDWIRITWESIALGDGCKRNHIHSQANHMN